MYQYGQYTCQQLQMLKKCTKIQHCTLLNNQRSISQFSKTTNNKDYDEKYKSRQQNNKKKFINIISNKQYAMKLKDQNIKKNISNSTKIEKSIKINNHNVNGCDYNGIDKKNFNNRQRINDNINGNNHYLCNNNNNQMIFTVTSRINKYEQQMFNDVTPKIPKIITSGSSRKKFRQKSPHKLQNKRQILLNSNFIDQTFSKNQHFQQNYQQNQSIPKQLQQKNQQKQKYETVNNQNKKNYYFNNNILNNQKQIQKQNFNQTIKFNKNLQTHYNNNLSTNYQSIIDKSIETSINKSLEKSIQINNVHGYPIKEQEKRIKNQKQLEINDKKVIEKQNNIMKVSQFQLCSENINISEQKYQINIIKQNKQYMNNLKNIPIFTLNLSDLKKQQIKGQKIKQFQDISSHKQQKIELKSKCNHLDNNITNLQNNISQLSQTIKDLCSLKFDSIKINNQIVRNQSNQHNHLKDSLQITQQSYYHHEILEFDNNQVIKDNQKQKVKKQEKYQKNVQKMFQIQPQQYENINNNQNINNYHQQNQKYINNSINQQHNNEKSLQNSQNQFLKYSQNQKKLFHQQQQQNSDKINQNNQKNLNNNKNHIENHIENHIKKDQIKKINETIYIQCEQEEYKDENNENIQQNNYQNPQKIQENYEQQQAYHQKLPNKNYEEEQQHTLKHQIQQRIYGKIYKNKQTTQQMNKKSLNYQMYKTYKTRHFQQKIIQLPIITRPKSINKSQHTHQYIKNKVFYCIK